MGPFGSKIKAENFVRAGVPVIKGGNLGGTYLSETSFDFLTQEKASELASSKAGRLDIVVTHRGTLGQVGLIPESSKYEQYVVSQSQLKMSFDTEKVDPYYVYYFLRSPLGQSRLLANTSQVGVPAIAQALTTIRQLQIPLPPRDSQTEITATLRALDDRISLLRETNATLEAIAQALFKSWFVDFDPVRAKMEGRAPEGMDEATAALFPDSFEETELGLVPRGWRVAELGDVLTLRNQRTQPSEQTKSLPYVPIESIGSKTPFLAESKSGEEANSSLILFEVGDILLGAMRPYFHKVCIAPFRGVTRTTVFTLVSRNPRARAFGLFLAYQDSTIEYATQHSEGSTIPYAKWKNSLEKMAIVLPPDSIQQRFSELVESAIARANLNNQHAQMLASVRDTLLPRLISGQTQLKNLPSLMQETVA